MNRAALPQLRKQLVGVSSCGYLPVARVWRYAALPGAVLRAAKASMDAMAISYAGELARWGIETSIVVQRAFTKGTNHFCTRRLASRYDTCERNMRTRPNANIPDVALKGLAALEPADADPSTVADAIVKVVDTPFGKRPCFRVHIDPSQDGAEIVNGVADRVRAELLRRIGLEDVVAAPG